MNCPYCKAEFRMYIDNDPIFVNRGYGYDDTCWDEYRCDCPKCGKEFRWFEDYTYVGLSKE